MPAFGPQVNILRPKGPNNKQSCRYRLHEDLESSELKQKTTMTTKKKKKIDTYLVDTVKIQGMVLQLVLILPLSHCRLLIQVYMSLL